MKIPVIKLWPLPALTLASFMISWGAEAAQYFFGQGLALAAVAFFQALPEASVEAAVAWRAGHDPNLDTSLALANATGSLRILVGLAWPLIYTIAEFFHWRRHGRFLAAIRLESTHGIQVICLIPCLLMGAWIWSSGTLGLGKAAALVAVYLGTLVLLARQPSADEEEAGDLPGPVRKIVKLPPLGRNLAILTLLLGGGWMLYYCAAPFLTVMQEAALALGIAPFVVVQWLAPVLSELPEQLTAYNWAARVRTAPMALMNMVSSNLFQWTVLIAIAPVFVSWGAGHPVTLELTDTQRLELLLTLAQALLGLLMIWKLEFYWAEALLLLVLWILPYTGAAGREIALWGTGLGIAAEFAYLLMRPGPRAHRAAWRALRARPA